MAELIPDDIIACILLRVPVKSLLCFRCVSKTWCALIQSKSFIKQQLDQSILASSNHRIILQSNIETARKSLLHSLSLCSLDKTLELVPPVNPNYYVSNLVGSCNGLLCLLYEDFSDQTYIPLFTIWNPSTQKHVKLPALVIEYNSQVEILTVVHGFGYDSVSDNYKVVNLVHSSIKSFIEVNVCSMNSKSWKVKQAIDVQLQGYLFSDINPPGVFVCGALHSLLAKYGESLTAYSVVAFDFATEEHMIVTLPDFCDDEEAPVLSGLGGWLSIVCKEKKMPGVSVWVMKDYGIGGSWTKLLSVSNFKIFRYVRYGITLAYSKSGDELLMMLHSGRYLWDLRKKKGEFADVPGHSNISHSLIWFESLVSLGENVENDEDWRKLERKKELEKR